MGLTIYNKHSSIDLGSIGFLRLRTRIAYMHSQKLGDFYQSLDKQWTLTEHEKEKFLEDYNLKLRTIDEDLNVSHEFLDFLYESDMEGTMSVKHCRAIYNTIKNYQEDFTIGYIGRSDCARFSDFKRIVKECRDRRIQLYWD